MHEFKLRIELGNDAMRTWDDVADLLAYCARTFADDQSPATQGGMRLRDANGNAVGECCVVERETFAERSERSKHEPPFRVIAARVYDATTDELHDAPRHDRGGASL